MKKCRPMAHDGLSKRGAQSSKSSSSKRASASWMILYVLLASIGDVGVGIPSGVDPEEAIALSLSSRRAIAAEYEIGSGNNCKFPCSSLLDSELFELDGFIVWSVQATRSKDFRSQSLQAQKNEQS